MHHPRRPRRIAVLLATAAVAGGLLSGAGPAGPAAADTSGLSFTDDTSLPVQVSRSAADPGDDEPEPIYVDFTTSVDAHDVTVTASGAGLRTSVSPTGSFDLAAGRSGDAEVDVTAAAPGFHALTVTLTSSDAGTTSETFPYVWTAGGGYDVPATGSLAGLSFGYQGYSSSYSTCEGCSDLEQHRVTFVSPSQVVRSDLSVVDARCSTRQHACGTYHYDADTGLVQIDTGYGAVIGKVTSAGLYTSGLIEADPQDYDEFYAEATLHPLLEPATGTRFGATFTFTNRQSDPSGIGGFFYTVRLALHHDGHYRLRYSVGGRHGGTVRQSGTYRVRSGRLLLRHRVVTRRHRHHDRTLTVPVERLAPTPGDAEPGLVVQLPLHLRGKGRPYDGGVLLDRRH